MKNKSLVILNILLVASLILVGCSPAAAPTSAATTAPGATAAPATKAPAGQKVTITLATWTGADESKELQAVIDKGNAAATDYQSVLQAIPAEYYTKLQNMIPGSTAPDLMWLSQEYVANYADSGALMDVTDQVAKRSDQPAP